MPSRAEQQAAQRRARARVMAMAAIIQTDQPDSLVLLPPGSAGETRAVGERWPARVVWASDTRAARWLTCCRAAVFCADGVEEFTRQRAELAAIFALGTPQLPTGRVLQGPPQFTLGDAFDELGCECGTTLMQICGQTLGGAKRVAGNVGVEAPFTPFELKQHETFAQNSKAKRGGHGYIYCALGQPAVLFQFVAPVLDGCGFADPGAIEAAIRSADASERVSSFCRAVRLLGADGQQASEEQIVKRFVELLTRLRQACVKPPCLRGDWHLTGQLRMEVFAEQVQLRADHVARGRLQLQAAGAADAHAAGVSAAHAANAVGARDRAAAAAGDYVAAAQSDGAFMNFVHFLVNNPGAQETATVAVDMVDSVLDGECVDYHIFKRALKMVHLVKLQAAQLPQGEASTVGRTATGASNASPAPRGAALVSRGTEGVENMHPNVSATPKTQEKGNLGKRSHAFAVSTAQHGGSTMDVDGSS